MNHTRLLTAAGMATVVGAWLVAATATTASAETLDIRLALEGRDVTGAFDAEVGFFDVSLPKNAPPAFRCKAGVRTVVPNGTFRLDVKSDDVVSSSRPVVTSDGKPSAVIQELRIQVVRAGLLHIPSGSYPAGSRIDVLSTKTGMLYQRRMGREASIVSVPAEPSVAGVLDPARRLIGFMKIDPAASELVELPALPRLRRDFGQLHVGFRYPEDFEEKGRTLSPILITDRGRFPADTVVERGASLEAFWFDTPATEGLVYLESLAWTTADVVKVRVPDRAALGLASMPLARRPPLTVTFDAAERFAGQAVSLDLLDCREVEDSTGSPDLSRCTPVSTRRGLASDSFRFERLALTTYALKWRCAGLSDVLRVDIRKAAPLNRTIRIKPVEVRGKVWRGADPVGGVRLSFASATVGSETTAETDEDGAFEVELPRPGQYEVRIETPKGRVLETVASVKMGTDLEFLIPQNDLRARVVELTGGSPVPGARVTGTMLVGDGNSTWIAVASADGEAALPPLPNGVLRLEATAEGYEPSDPVVITVDSETREQLAEIRMTRADGRRLSLFELSGAPAAGATVSIPGFRDARAGEDGVAVLPNRVPDGAGLFAWDRSGRLVFFRLVEARDQTVRFPPAGPPVRLRAVRPDGRPVTDWAPAVSVDGIPFSGPSDQGRLAGSDLQARRDGTMRLAGFPAIGVLVVAPDRNPELSVTRVLPVEDEIVFSIPLSDIP